MIAIGLGRARARPKIIAVLLLPIPNQRFNPQPTSTAADRKEINVREEKPRCETCTYDTRSDPITPVTKCLYCGNYAIVKAAPEPGARQK
jgi:hypothetical protein